MKAKLMAVLMAVLLCVVNGFYAHAADVCPAEIDLDTLAISTIHFRHDRAAIDSTYLDNQSALNAIRTAFGQIAAEDKESIASIIIEGSSSPIGHEVYNQRLSLRRAKKAETFLRTIPGFAEVEMQVVGKGEDWQTFAANIQENYSRKNRQDLLNIINSGLSNKEKKQKIQALDSDGTTWRHLTVNYMTSSRHAVTIVVVKKSRITEPLPKLQAPKDTLQAPQTGLRIPHKPDTAPTQQPTQQPAHQPAQQQGPTPLYSLRTNLLVPALNVGAELPLGNSWSVAADYYFPWFWPSQKNKNCFEFLGGSIEARYWFGRDRKPQDRLKGHSIGAYFAGGYYDFERNYRGMQGEFLSPGLDYTYSMAIGRQKNLHLQFTLAVGYIRSWGRTYNVYGDYGELYPDEGTVIWDYVGPTKAAVTLVVPFYKKEGRR